MIETLHLFRPLNDKLLEVLKDLSAEDWTKQTVAGTWTVKDVAAHLLDGNIRAISIHRDGQELKPDRELSGYEDVVRHLNRLNGDWVVAMRRVSPKLILEWLKETHEGYVSHLEKLDPGAPAKFSVAWAGENVSANWFHVAREFTEKWHHQQQIRDAVARPGILTPEFYWPVLDTFFRALPYRYQETTAPNGTVICIEIGAPIGHGWFLERRDNRWLLTTDAGFVQTRITIPSEISWKLFTKAIRYEDVKGMIVITGEERFASPALHMITVMA